MNFLKKIFKKKSDDKDKKENFTFVYDIAERITSNDSKVMKKIKLFINDPEEYEKSYSMRDVDVPDKFNNAVFYWLSMVDELEEGCYLFSADYKHELVDFLWGLEQLKNYSLIEKAVSECKLDKNGSVEAWISEINRALKSRFFVCMIDIDSDSYELIIASCEVYKKISEIAASKGFTIKKIRND